LLIIPGLLFLLMHEKFRILGFTAIFVIIILLILQGKSYYTLGIFPMLVAAGALTIEKYIRINVIKWSVPLLIIVLTIPITPLGLPVYDANGLVLYFKRLENDYGLTLGRTFEDGTIHSLPQDYADQLGWEELTAVTSKAFSSIDDKSSVLIYAENYGQASAIFVIGKKYGLPEPISFNDTYWYWKPKAIDPNVKTLIYINDELNQDVDYFFKNISVSGQITNAHAREYGLKVYLCQNPKDNINIIYQAAVKRESQQ
jgi:hypothetical protein